MADNNEYTHFQGKDAVHHIAEVQARGIFASHEIHGAETPGYLFAFCDAARDTAVLLLLTSLVLGYFDFTIWQFISILAIFSCGWAFWKLGRGAWLAWSRLERLHRVMQEEKHEIETHREQEREELKALYQAKGFQGRLLDEVVDVLMADGDRLLRVMLEEEMGFRLEENEHPLVQGLGAAFGVLFSSLLIVSGFLLCGQIGVFIATLIALFAAAAVSARFEGNRVIPAICWNLGLTLFAYAIAYYGLRYLVV